VVRQIAPAQLRPAAREILDHDGRLMYATGVDMGVKGIKVDYYFSFDHLDRSRHTILRTYLDRENPVIKSVTPLTPQADWAERELIEFLGVRCEEHPNPTHLWLPLNWEEMYSAGTEDKGAIHPQPLSKQVHDNIIALPVTAVPYGPYHPAFIESNYFKMSVEDEVVKKADLKLGFNHRSIIKLMERRDYFKDIYLAERVCGLCKVHHALNFCMSVEKIGDIQIPQRAKLLRTLACEMERVQSHLLAIGIASDLIGYKTMLMHSLRIREDIQDSLELITGQRITHGFITIGGVRRDVTETQADFVRGKLNSMKKALPELYDQMESNDVWAGRLRNVGVLKPGEAIRLGAVGPTTRAAGRRLDVRKNSPYAAYEDVDWDIVTENGGDSYARVKVKMREALMSIHIAEQCLDRLRTAPQPLLAKFGELPVAEAIAKTEPPRGELLYHLSSNGTNTPEYVRIRVPTFMNGYIMLKLIQGSYVGDVPAIMGSIDPCYSCTDRVTVHKDVQIIRRNGTNG
jgi:formate hydrogenlyase subunit 5